MRWNLLNQTTEVLAIHAALVHTGEIVYFSGDEHDKGQNERGQIFHTRLFDTASLAVRRVSSPGSDVFCAGQSLLADGRVLVVGGTEAFEDDVGGIHGAAHHFAGLRDSWIYDPDSRHWIRTAYLLPQPFSTIGGGRWYPSLTTLPDGRVLAIAGHPSSSDFRPQHNNISPEVYSALPGPWGRWAMYSERAWRELDYYARLHVLPDGRLFCLTTINNRTHAFDPVAGFWQDLSAGPTPDYNGIGVTSVLLPLKPSDGYRARILACNHPQPTLYDYTSRTWQPTAPRALAGHPERVDACAVLLPTGDVFVCGGTAGNNNKADTNGVREGELFRFSGGGGVWSALPPAQVVRNYHSVALLMPDGRVWTAGSNHDAGRSFGTPGVDNRELQIELFEPDYFGNPNRPVLNESPGDVACAQSFLIATPDPNVIARVVMVRAGSVTHAFNSDQRLVELEFAVVDGSHLRAKAPPNNRIAPPGDYLLFIIDNANLPSIGSFTRIRNGDAMEGHAILFEHANFHGAHKHVFRAEANLNAGDDNVFNDRVSSIVILKGNWEFFRHAGFNSRYPVVLGPGLYSFVGDISISNDDMSSLRPTDAAATVRGRPIEGHVILFEHAHFHGAHKHVFHGDDNLNAADDNLFNDKTSSIAVLQSNWRFYRHAGFVDSYKEPATSPPGDLLLGPGLYPWVQDAGVQNDDLSSLKPDPDEHEEIVGAPIEGHVVLFEHAQFHGSHKHVLRAEGNLNATDDNVFNDRVSSIAVLETYWGFFRHADFGDQYPNLLGGAETIYPWVQDIGIQNDDLSSLMPWPDVR